jgi:serine O-acetyltransferase
MRESGHILIYFFGLKIRFKNPLVSQLGDCCSIHNLQRFLDAKVNFPHPVGIVIARDVVVGKNCTIYQNVTIGKKKYGFFEDKNTVIGDNVTIFANACIIGNVNIGDNARIGAGAIVLEDVPANAVVAGNPAKVIKYRNKEISNAK